MLSAYFLSSSSKRVISIAIFSFVLPFFLTASTYAGTTTKDKTFSVSGYSQGATLTPKYYVFTEWSGSSFKVTRCDRPNGNNCKSSSSFSGKPSSMYYEWGSNYAQAILRRAKSMVCINLTTMSEESGKCGSILDSAGLNKKNGGGDVDGKRQGWTKYGKYYYRGYGTNKSGEQNYIWVFSSPNGDPDEEWKIPFTGGEIEDVMVDGNTGQMWFTWYGSSGTVTYYKVDKSVFAKYIQPSAGGGGTVPSVDVEPYDDSNLAIRDETAKPETPESTYDGSVDTNFFGAIQDDEKGCGTFMVLNFIIDILTFGIVLAAVIGIAISGTTYLRSKDDEQQITKAKRRIYEIVIGLAVYAVVYATINFLLPGGKFESFSECSPASNTSSAVQGDTAARAKAKAEAKAKAKARAKAKAEAKAKVKSQAKQ